MSIVAPRGVIGEIRGAEGVGFEPTKRRQPLTAFRVPRTRPDYATPPGPAFAEAQGTNYPMCQVQTPTSSARERRERDLNPRGGANPQRHFQCRALGQTMRSLRSCPSGCGAT